jgi:hypothetical protein
MTDKPDARSEAGKEEEVWGAISAFEQILQAMPNDRSSLDALADAYQKIGDHTRAKEYLVRLCNVLLAEPDVQGAIALLDRVKPYADSDATAKGLVARIEELAAVASAGTAERPRSGGGGEAQRGGFNMADELAMAWNLLQANEITQDEYGGIVQDLTEMSVGSGASTVSVLHVLESRSFKNLEKIIGFISQDSGTPIISLASFELPYDAVSLLPLDLVVKRGVLVFELFGKDALVAVLNPYNKPLRKDVESTVGRRCHFFVVVASEFDHALERVKSLIEERAAGARHEEESSG